MNLRDARVLFDQLRYDESRVLVTGHALWDHPARGFTREEVTQLVQGKDIWPTTRWLLQ